MAHSQAHLDLPSFTNQGDAWQQRADALLPDALQGACATAIDQQVSPPHVFLSHAGEQKAGVVDVIYEMFRAKYPHVDVYRDVSSVAKGSRALLAIGRACRSNSVGVLVVSREFVRKKHCMAELHILLRRWRANEVQLLPVLYGGLTVDDLPNMRRLYDSEEWCVKEEKPDSSTLDEWATDALALKEIAMIDPREWRGEGELVKMVVDSAHTLLVAARHAPPGHLEGGREGTLTPPMGHEEDPGLGNTSEAVALAVAVEATKQVAEFMTAASDDINRRLHADMQEGNPYLLPFKLLQLQWWGTEQGQSEEESFCREAVRTAMAQANGAVECAICCERGHFTGMDSDKAASCTLVLKYRGGGRRDFTLFLVPKGCKVGFGLECLKNWAIEGQYGRGQGDYEAHIWIPSWRHSPWMTGKRGYLIGANGEYLSVRSSLDIVTLCLSKQPCVWEIMDVDGPEKALRPSAHLQYIKACSNSTVHMSGSITETEKWVVEPQDSGCVALRSHHGTYLSARSDKKLVTVGWVSASEQWRFSERV